MSADNWGVCPQCKKLNDEKNKKRILDVVKKYGKVPPDEFVQLSKEANKPIMLEEHLREDYELGVGENGFFEVSYRCSCDVCGFEHSFEHTKQLKV